MPSDHNLLLAKIEIKLAVANKRGPGKKLNVESLRDPQVREEVAQVVNERMAELNAEQTHLLEMWNSFRDALNETAMCALAPDKGHAKVAKNAWMNDHILQLLCERRRYRNCNSNKYRQLNAEIRGSISRAKLEWMDRKCQEFERLQSDPRICTKNLRRRQELQGINKYPVLETKQIE